MANQEFLSQFAEQINNLGEINSSMTEINNSRVQMSAQINDKIGEIKNLIGDVATKINDITSQTGKLLKIVNNNGNIVNQLQDENVELKRRINELQNLNEGQQGTQLTQINNSTELERLRSIVEENDNKIAELNDQNTEYKNQIETATSVIANTIQNINSLSNNEYLNGILTELTNVNTSLSNLIQNIPDTTQLQSAGRRKKNKTKHTKRLRGGKIKRKTLKNRLSKKNLKKQKGGFIYDDIPLKKKK
jgi:chromosome segregation ATPase